ncbi:MAG: hypothetical protein AAGA56_04060 [Myxococcota bacterium]
MVRPLGIGVGALGVSVLVGCAPLPEPVVQRSLYIDARQLVKTEERLGWLIDRTEIEDLTPSMLQSVCQVSEEDRIELLDWIDSEVARFGGPSRERYLENDKSMTGLGSLVTLERVRALLERTDELAAADCPYYLESDPEFRGVQQDTERFVVLGETFGGLMVLFREGQVNLGAAGSGRIMPAWGIDDRVTVATGVELGATAVVELQDEQTNATSVAARPAGGIPVLVRIHDDTWVFDAEAAVLTQYYQERLLLPPGARAATAVGLSSVRIAGFMPVGSLFVAYEYYPAFRDLPRQHGIRFGTKVGLDWDP